MVLILFVSSCRSPREIVDDSPKRYAGYPDYPAAIYPSRHKRYNDHNTTFS